MADEEAVDGDTTLPSTLLGPSEIVAGQRKNSSSDLHSRLKTRKVLGVGEIRDDGDIYRSKISQILGHSEHLYVKLPKGLFYWQAANVVYFFGSGLLCLLLPEMAISLEILVCPGNSASGDVLQLHHLPVRFYGSALIGFCVLYRGLMVTRERSYIASGLLGGSVLFSLQAIVTLPWMWSCRHSLSNFQLFLFASKSLLGIVGNCLYYGVTSSPSSSVWSMLSRLLRRIGVACSAGDSICVARTPVNSSNYNIAASANIAPAVDPPTSDIQQSTEAIRQRNVRNDRQTGTVEDQRL